MFRSGVWLQHHIVWFEVTMAYQGGMQGRDSGKQLPEEILGQLWRKGLARFHEVS